MTGERTDGRGHTDKQEPTSDVGRDEPQSDGGVVQAEPTAALSAALPASTLGRQVLATARQHYALAWRSRWTPALTAIFLAFGLALATFSGGRVGPGQVDVVVVSLAALVTYLVPLAALAFGFDAVVGADEAGWLDVVFALPTPRWAVILGVYLGRAAALSGAVLVGFGATGVYLAWYFGAPSPLFGRFLLAAVGLALAFLAIGVLLSALAREKTHALGAALGAWGYFVLVHDLLALGAVAAFELPDAALSALVLANPVDVFRLAVLAGVEETAGGFAAVFADVGLSTGLLVLATAAWITVPIVLASWAVARRRV